MISACFPLTVVGCAVSLADDPPAAHENGRLGEPARAWKHFDMIGDTSTGGPIAIMLGRVRMSIQENITAYSGLSDKDFKKAKHRVNLKGKIQGRFDDEMFNGPLSPALKPSARIC